MQKQPRALGILCFTEIWERYGFVMLQTLLVLYLIQVFNLSDEISYATVGSITALAYVNAVLGGYFADRVIGHRLAILSAALMLSVGYFLLANAHSFTVAAWALGMITLATGLFKPNVSSLVGSLYTVNDVRRHSGFTLFYVAVNVGDTLASSVPAYIQQYSGWPLTYLSAMLMIIIGFVVFWVGIRYFKITDISPVANKKLGIFLLLIASMAIIIASHYIILHPEFAELVFFAIAIISIAIVLYQSWREQGAVRSRLLAYLVLTIMTAIYWALYFQVFFSMNLFVDRVVDRNIFGHLVPPAMFIAFESFGVIILGLIFSWLWKCLANSRFNPGIPMKFTLGLLMLVLGFGLLYLSSFMLEASGLVMPGWLVIVYLLISASELLLPAISLSMVTELVPVRMVGMMMGILFLALGLGGKLVGLLAKISAIPQTLSSIPQMEEIYRGAFLTYFVLSLIVTALSFILVFLLRRLIRF